MDLTKVHCFLESVIFVGILLIGVPLASVEGKKVVKPGEIAKYTAPILPEIENFSKLEALLQNLTDEANLYQIAESSLHDVLEKLLQSSEVHATIEECKKFFIPTVCSDTLYRSVDGSCNNLKYPDWGKAITEQGRLLPPNYEGTHGIRKSVTGEDLPSSRRISLSMRNVTNPSELASANFVFFGQLITHDLVLTPLFTENGKAPNCTDTSPNREPYCVFENMPPDDPFFAQYNITYQTITRAAPYPKCSLANKRGVINKKSSYIDASNVYDNTDEHLKKLRTNDGTGKLRTQDTKFGKLLPKNHDQKTLFCPAAKIEKCFEGGDDRINQHSLLITFQTIYVRLHNNIADTLHQLNPNWDDDKIFQESRRIVIALHQYVIYEEYLPLLIGPGIMEKYDLYPDFQKGSQYNDEVDPSIFVVFSAAAFRAHSVVPTYVSASMPQLKFRNTISNIKLIHRGHLDKLLAGASELPSENYDEFQTDDMSKYVYKAPGETYGGDLTATDIQRGRDVGLPSYTEVLHFCHRVQIQDFSQLSNSGLMTENNTRELMNIYNDARDIDLIVGLMREMRDGKSVFGPTATCIATLQFYRLKFGDSFYFTHKNGRNPFIKEQLDSIQNSSLAHIMCETTKVEKVRTRPLQIPSENNPLVLCRSLSPMNLMPWKE